MLKLVYNTCGVTILETRYSTFFLCVAFAMCIAAVVVLLCTVLLSCVYFFLPHVYGFTRCVLLSYIL